jgi:hypothetical protein
MPAQSKPTSELSTRLEDAIARDDSFELKQLAKLDPSDRRDRFLTLLQIYDLHALPVAALGNRARHASDPAIAAIKQRCEAVWLSELAVLAPPEPADEDPIAAMRTLAARDRLPEVYKWLARDARWDQVVRFLALEGGPDAGFDDLVAQCQVGLTGRAKLELATNYWDEMGNGDLAKVHTTLHRQMADAILLPHLPTEDLPTSALARTALGGLLSTNRWLQPEALGAFGLIELQAGPRCRLVLQAFERCDAPATAYPFYEVHAEVDPRHGKDWLENAIAPTVSANPEWAPRIVRGARWRSAVNAAFVRDAAELLGASDSSEAVLAAAS